VHAAHSGACCKVCPDDENALNWIKILLSYLPNNNLEAAPTTQVAEQNPEHIAALDSIVPSSGNKPYNMLEVINGIIDTGSFLEIYENFAPNIIVGLARLDGKTVGIVANMPKNLAGCLDINASIKAARFVRFCDAFNIPLINLVDVPGCLPGVDQEHNGIIKHGAKLLYAYCEATVPKLTVILRKAYGGTYCSTHLGADVVLAWPSAEIAVLGPEGAVNIMFRKEIETAENPTLKREEYIKTYTEKFANPQMAAELGYINDIIEPSQTRKVLIQYLNPLLHKRVDVPKRKHGNIPL
jgi:acetyl-CoA carboxylase carboxyltransferase component